MKTLDTLFSNAPRRESGMALITGLILMVILTLITIAAMRTTTLEELMARNARDRDLAFQAAEAALRAGEQTLTGAVLPAFAVNTGYTPRIINPANSAIDGSRPEYWTSTHNWTAQSVAIGWQPTGTSAPPRFVVEQMQTGAATGGGLGFGALTDQGVYRVTARGVGGSANTVVILQAIYQR